MSLPTKQLALGSFIPVRTVAGMAVVTQLGPKVVHRKLWNLHFHKPTLISGLAIAVMGLSDLAAMQKFN